MQAKDTLGNEKGRSPFLKKTLQFHLPRTSFILGREKKKNVRKTKVVLGPKV
jgi:hypothetical protein